MINTLPTQCAGQAQHERAFTPWQIGCRHRVQGCQVLPSFHSGAASTHTPLIIIIGWRAKKARSVGTKWGSMCFLAKRLPTARAKLTSSTIPAIGYCPPQEVLRTAYGASLCGKHSLCRHVLSDKMTASAACNSDSLRYSLVRV